MNPKNINFETDDVVIVTQRIPSTRGLRLLLPSGNRFGLTLLTRLLRNRLDADFLRDEEAAINACGELNRGTVFFAVNDIFRALASLKDELVGVGLLESAIMGYYCKSELIFRAWHPSSSVPFYPIEDYIIDIAQRRYIELTLKGNAK
jgi:hypothetical protein